LATTVTSSSASTGDWSIIRTIFSPAAAKGVLDIGDPNKHAAALLEVEPQEFGAVGLRIPLCGDEANE
jgi:hypothetical protein